MEAPTLLRDLHCIPLEGPGILYLFDLQKLVSTGGPLRKKTRGPRLSLAVCHLFYRASHIRSGDQLRRVGLGVAWGGLGFQAAVDQLRWSREQQRTSRPTGPGLTAARHLEGSNAPSADDPSAALGFSLSATF